MIGTMGMSSVLHKHLSENPGMEQRKLEKQQEKDQHKERLVQKEEKEEEEEEDEEESGISACLAYVVTSSSPAWRLITLTGVNPWGEGTFLWVGVHAICVRYHS